MDDQDTQAGTGTAAVAGDVAAHSSMGHVLSPRLLLSVLFALVALTAATVFVTSIDLGSQGNLVVAMVIATVKAALVATYFMHLRWDRRFNLLVFLSGVLFLILFLSMTLTDRREYQDAIDRLERTQARQAAP